MTDIVPDSLAPWLVGGLTLLLLLTLTITLRAWRESKRSPYFFLRVQAARKMQRYLVMTAVLLLVTVTTTAYAWQVPEENTPQVAVLRHAKPVLSAVSMDEVLAAAEEGASPTAVNIDLGAGSNGVVASSSMSDPLLRSASLPDEYNQLEPSVELRNGTSFGEIDFSLDISGDYQSIDPGTRFVAGYFTLYATFEYEELADGMVWSWVWRRNGEVIEGGNQEWSYGAEGPGYVYFRPEEGFDLGEYTLDLWINGQLVQQASFIVGDSVAANN